MSSQALLFNDDPGNRAIQARFKETFTDRKIARHLMSADDDERDAIEWMMVMEPAMTLYEAIELCIKYPAERE